MGSPGLQEVRLDIFDKVLDEMGDVQLPDQTKMERLQKMGARLVEIDRLISDHEDSAKKLKEEKNEIASRLMVDLMLEMNVDHLGMADSGVDLVLSPYYHASISKDLPEEERQAAFDYLETIGGGDLVKTVLSVSAGRGTLEKMRHLQQRVTQILAELELEASVDADQNVAWNSLTAFVRERIEAGDVVDAKRIGGATIGSVVKIVKRKK